jgi:hypothetical protein
VPLQNRILKLEAQLKVNRLAGYFLKDLRLNSPSLRGIKVRGIKPGRRQRIMAANAIQFVAPRYY